jgi:xanthine dehydrogenase accessory factor
VTLFHDHDWEPALLNAALKTPACFVGSLGSRRTHEIRRELLRQMGFSETSLLRLRGPIGLVPSLRDAPSIALSAMAEVVAAFREIK